jgi:single-strand DNA-binding protein
MTDFNRVILIGRLTRDPEKSYTTAAMALTKFGLAVNNGFGENKKTVFVDITTWGKTAEFVSTYFTKGKEILVEGRLELDNWTSKEGDKRSKLYVTGEKVSFSGGKNESSGDHNSDASGSQMHEPAPAKNVTNQLNDEDIPF